MLAAAFRTATAWMTLNRHARGVDDIKLHSLAVSLLVA